MTHHQINLIKSSWKLVEAMEPEAVGSIFYNYLFEIAPGVRPMFRNPIREQSKKTNGDAFLYHSQAGPAGRYY